MALRELQSKKLIVAKGILFVLVGFAAGILVVTQEGVWWMRCLVLAICVWSFCRAYYFAFYVIQHYVDSTYRYSGLLSAVRSLLKSPRGGNKSDED